MRFMVSMRGAVTMAVQKRIDGKLTTLSDRQIKAEVQRLTGWTNTEYNKQYDVYRNKVRNYERTIGAEKGSIKANEEFYRTIRKESDGYPLTPQQEAIKTFTSASTSSYSKMLNLGGKGAQRAEASALISLTGETVIGGVDPDGVIIPAGYEGGTFSGLLSKSAKTREAWEKYVKSRKTPITAEQANKFLSNQAKALHKRQARELERNRALYGNGRTVGTP